MDNRQHDSLFGTKTFTQKVSPLQFTVNTELSAIFQFGSAVSGSIYDRACTMCLGLIPGLEYQASNFKEHTNHIQPNLPLRGRISSFSSPANIN